MNYILFDSFRRDALLPFVYTRPVADIRVGITTIREKWEMLLQTKTSSLTEDYLGVKYPLKQGKKNVLINGSVIPTEELVEKIKTLKKVKLCQKKIRLLPCIWTRKMLI